MAAPFLFQFIVFLFLLLACNTSLAHKYLEIDPTSRMEKREKMVHTFGGMVLYRVRDGSGLGSVYHSNSMVRSVFFWEFLLIAFLSCGCYSI